MQPAGREASAVEGARARLRAFQQGRDGATAVEFAFVAPLLFLFVLGVLEVGLCFAADTVLRNATNMAARTGRTGYVDDASTRDATVLRIIEGQASTFLDSHRLVFSSKAYSGFDGIGKPEPFVDANGNGRRDDGESYTDVNGNGTYDLDRGADGYGGANQIVVYTVTYPWSFFTPLVGRLFSAEGVLPLKATAVIQNEPF